MGGHLMIMQLKVVQTGVASPVVWTRL